MSEPTKADRTRARILEVATDLFAAKSYDGVSLRAVARGADVDPALVSHYFGSKNGLFHAVLDAAIRPVEAGKAVAAQDPAEWGSQLVRVVEGIWASPARPALLALFRSGLGGHTELLRDFVTSTILSQFVSGLPGPVEERRMRATFAGSQVIGLIVARHIVAVEPLASLDIDEVVAAVGPTLNRYLTGNLTAG